jgi:hypothetical protein
MSAMFYVPANECLLSKLLLLLLLPAGQGGEQHGW